MEQITPQQKKFSYHVYCLDCDWSEYVSTLAEVGKIRDEHNGGPHEIECYDEANDRMVPDGEAAVAFEESLPEMQ